MKVAVEYVEDADEGELLVLRRALSSQKALITKNKRRTSSIQNVLYTAVCALLLLMEGVIPMWPPPPWLTNYNSRPSLIHSLTQSNE